MSVPGSVQQMIGVEITGNVIPMPWYENLRRDGKRAKDGKPARIGKPHTNAIILLADIVYWYRPIEVRDEITGNLIAHRKKFKADKLQRSYAAFSEMYGLTKDQVRDALKFLADKGVISLEFRNFPSNGVYLSNVLYIGLDVDRLKEITRPIPALNPIGGGVEPDTYTEITTENTTKTITLAPKGAGANNLKSLAEYKFQTLTSLKRPSSPAEAQKRWWTPLREICELGEWEQSRVEDLITKSVAHMRAQRLSMSSPQSILQVARAVASGNTGEQTIEDRVKQLMGEANGN